MIAGLSIEFSTKFNELKVAVTILSRASCFQSLLDLPSGRVSIPTFKIDPNRLTRLDQSKTTDSSIIALVALIELEKF